MVPDFITAGFSDFFSGVTEVTEVATEAVDLISEVIVAINHNAKESIFANADFGIVGDYTDVVTQLITEVKQGFVFGLKEESHV